ncbi:MAG: ROK family protein [Bacteroidota bacterium]
MSNSFAIGVDVGGSHITTSVINLDKGVILEDTITEQDVDNSAEAIEIIALWSKTISDSISKSQEEVKGIGIAMPGPFDYAKGISLIKGVQKFEKLYGLNVKQALQTKLDTNLPIRFINDASAFAVGEVFAGSGKGYNRVLAITLGTGFGSAFTENGIPIIEREDVPEIGCVYHLPFKESIADDYFSTRWCIGRYKELTGKEVFGVKEIADIVEKDKMANQVFEEFGTNLGGFLAPWLKKFGAEVLVIGGNISKAWHLYEDKFHKELANEGVNVVTAVSQLKEHAALLGSAHLIDEKYWENMKEAVALM